MDYAYSRFGGTLYAPKGTYLFNSLSRNWSNYLVSITLHGDGPTSTRFMKYTPSDTTPLLNFSADANVLAAHLTLKDLSLDGASARTAVGVRLSQMAYCKLDRLYITSWRIGIDNVGSLVNDYYDITIHQCYTGFKASKSSTVYSNLNNFYNPKMNGNRYQAIDYGQGDDVKITGGDFESNGTPRKDASVNTGTDVLTLASSSWDVPVGTALILSTTGTFPTVTGVALNDTADYFWIPTGTGTGKVARTYANALAGTAVDFTSTGAPDTLRIVHAGTGAIIMRETMDDETGGGGSPGLAIATITNSHFEANFGRVVATENTPGLTLNLAYNKFIGNQYGSGSRSIYSAGAYNVVAIGNQSGGAGDVVHLKAEVGQSYMAANRFYEVLDRSQYPTNYNQTDAGGVSFPGFGSDIHLWKNKNLYIHQNVDGSIYHSFYNNGSNNLQISASSGKEVIIGADTVRTSPLVTSDFRAAGSIRLKFNGVPYLQENGTIFTSSDGIGFRGIDNGGTYAFAFYASGSGSTIIRNPIGTTNLEMLGLLKMVNLTASSAVATDAGNNLVSVTNTGSGNNVLATSPTVSTPTISGTGTVNGDWVLGTAGNGFYVKEGSNACMGVTTLVAGVSTVNTTKVTANSRIFLTRQSLGGTLGSSVDVTARTPGTSFTITAQGSILETSQVGWQIFEPAP
jgi:hypothetical protein